ncbi:hypothetical protein [Ensifer sp. NM-2]|uniref:hypothetical protein n=1 Tax=Ensifer sp. NM-2 TaxID=2109730 RepID=UPI001FE141AC|nr:hypothetical protein [Ensifer sp. NM-2]
MAEHSSGFRRRIDRGHPDHQTRAIAPVELGGNVRKGRCCLGVNRWLLKPTEISPTITALLFAAAQLRDWDPIGISDIPEAKDEYDAYAGVVLGMLINQNATSPTTSSKSREGCSSDRGAPIKQVKISFVLRCSPDGYANFGPTLV